MKSSEYQVAVGLGSNLGDRLAHLRVGQQYLRRILHDIHVSDVYETVPVGYPDQGPFLNACVIGATPLTPRQLLDELQHAERLAGRTSGGPRNGPRVLDLDLLLYGARTVREPDLVVPHPRLRQRAFVLVPLQDIAAEWRVPGEDEQPGPTVAELAAAIGAGGVIRTSMQLGEAG